ncbi:MAG TPA: peptide ABC transporter substrate-binding protein [Nitrospiraceae bacterium]|nr:peptide ABC transporter substrate-binding protein [Nitrospiraceae bacterium]
MKPTPRVVAASLVVIGAIALGTLPLPSSSAPAPQVPRISINAEPTSLDTGKTDEADDGVLIKQLFEGLTRLDKDGNPAPGVAERWHVSPDGKVYTFTLRRSARWSNGDPVTAHDFVYTYMRAFKPQSAVSTVSLLLYVVANAREYHTGKIADPGQVGFRALDDHTLRIRLHTPAPLFLKSLATQAGFPVSRKVDEQTPAWANEAATFVSNGPFRLAHWEHHRTLVFEPNPHYWARDQVKLNQIQIRIVTDIATVYKMFTDGQLDIAESLPLEVVGRLLAERKALVIPEARTWPVIFNHKVPPFGNTDIRKAFALAVNRLALSEVLPGPVPLMGWIPFGLSSGTGEFRRQAGNLYVDNDVLAAREHLRRGLSALGVRQLPPVVMRTWNRPVNVKISQALVAQWKRALGIQVTSESMEEQVFIAAFNKGDFTLAQVSQYALYDDAYSLMQVLRSDWLQPPVGYRNPEVDRLLHAAEIETNLDKRTKLMIEAERIAIGQDMAIAPLLSGVRVLMQNPRLQNVYRYAILQDDFSRAWFRP